MNALGTMLSAPIGSPEAKQLAGQYMSKLLLRPNGVKVLFAFIILTPDEDDGFEDQDYNEKQSAKQQQHDSMKIHEARLESLAKVILTIPSHTGLVPYFKNVIPQIVELSTGPMQVYSHAAAYLMVQLIEKRPKLSQDLMMKSVLEPLMRLTNVDVSQYVWVSYFSRKSQLIETSIGLPMLSGIWTDEEYYRMKPALIYACREYRKCLLLDRWLF